MTTETKLPAELEQLVAKWRSGIELGFFTSVTTTFKQCADELEALAPVLVERQQAAVAAALREAAATISKARKDDGSQLDEGLCWATSRILAVLTPEQQSALKRHDSMMKCVWDDEMAEADREEDRTHRLDKLRAVRDEAKWWKNRTHTPGWHASAECDECNRLAAAQRAVNEEEAGK